jgi:signal transduction histidine kinase
MPARPDGKEPALLRFDDTLRTVMAADLTTAIGRQSAYRQLVDLIGRGRVGADAQVIATLEAIGAGVPTEQRAAAARGLAFAKPPAALVAVFARDVLSVAAPVLRTARLDAAEWRSLLPTLSPSARAILRHRRDLGQSVERDLASFGPTDFVLEDGTAASEPVAAESTVDAPIEPATEPAVEATPIRHPRAIPASFTSLGSAAFSLPLVAEAVRHQEQGDRAAPRRDEPVPDGPFRIADVVARIDAYTERRERARVHANDAAPDAEARVRFETDARGIVTFADGPARPALIGLALGLAGGSGAASVDGAAAGAFRQRSRIRDANLHIAGGGPAAGAWLLSAVPVFDPASGRFTGYRGTARRPRPGEVAAPAPPAPDALRQLVHELRTPTNAIIGFSEMIALEVLGPVEAPYRERAASIQRHARDLLGAIDDLDLAARIDSDTLTLRTEAVSLKAVLGSVVHDLSPLTELRGAAVTLPDGDATIDGDRHAIERLFGRLLATLLSAMRRGEQLMMTVESDGASARLSITRPADLPDRADADCDVSDEAEAFAALPLGTGFALRLAGNLARELGGEIAFENDRIVVRLPTAADRQTSAATKS